MYRLKRTPAQFNNAVVRRGLIAGTNGIQVIVLEL